MVLRRVFSYLTSIFKNPFSRREELAQHTEKDPGDPKAPEDFQEVKVKVADQEELPPHAKKKPEDLNATEGVQEVKIKFVNQGELARHSDKNPGDPNATKDFQEVNIKFAHREDKNADGLSKNRRLLLSGKRPECDELASEIDDLERQIAELEWLENEEHQKPFDESKLREALENNDKRTIHEQRSIFRNIYATSVPSHDPIQRQDIEEQWKEITLSTKKTQLRAA